ncbi:SHOCT domain-containing protein [Acholeplasma laidlawii]|uniref:SHOCT domain-containing protein n=1 Tax=Acholeplasma laidlawii TaxID=2148 RepID=UPI0021F6B1A9|nr:SHOCT domain-containing protein [Acholeplasma laidlawii]
MDIVAIVLVVLKKWKPAMVISIIGLILSFFLAFIMPFIWVSFIIYLITLLVSIFGLKNEDNTYVTSSSTSRSTDTIETQLNKVQSLYNKGIISEEEYHESRKRILGF